MDVPHILRGEEELVRQGAEMFVSQDPRSEYDVEVTIRQKPRVTEDDAVWRSVPGYQGWYEVSDQGDVYSLARSGTKGGLLKKFVNNEGYKFVRLSKYGIVKNATVGRLVLLTFRGQPTAPGARAIHGAGGPLDDSLSNLRWGLASTCHPGYSWNHDSHSNIPGQRYPS